MYKTLGKLAAAAACLIFASTLRSGASAQTPAPAPSPSPAPAGVVRTYFIAADEIDWDYMPTGLDGMMGMAPTQYAKDYAQRSLHSLGRVYRKAAYREYTDGTFEHLKPRTPQDAYLGIVGPIIHAEVGDTIKVVFKNRGTHPYSMHPHGVRYEKASEGAAYADGAATSLKGGDSVAPGATFTYTWAVPERAGPGPADPSSVVWLYHSHVDERRDVNSGLIGAIVVTRHGMARPDGTPNDVDREFVAYYMGFDENQSWFIDQNIKRNASNSKKYDKFNARQRDFNGNNDIVLGLGSAPQNLRFSINGFQYADGPMPTMKVGERVRWYVVTLGEGVNFHTPHWHGNTVLVNGQRTDVLSLAPAQMITADMVPDAAGIWLFHCHLSEHMQGGMVAKYDVLP
jgi:FtsP/CotA-like multicopper oxidase with cupredoxin domain